MRIHRGMSNRDIADELVLSVRTVDTHVQRILGKLGFSSRAQIAAWYEAMFASDVADYVVLRIPPPGARRTLGERHRRRPSRCATSGIARANPCASLRKAWNPR